MYEPYETEKTQMAGAKMKGGGSIGFLLFREFIGLEMGRKLTKKRVDFVRDLLERGRGSLDRAGFGSFG
jgi:hypothetical protein